MAEMGMNKQFGNHIEVWLGSESARISISDDVLTAEEAHKFKCSLNAAIRYCEAYNKEQSLKDHPSLFPDDDN